MDDSVETEFLKVPITVRHMQCNDFGYTIRKEVVQAVYTKINDSIYKQTLYHREPNYANPILIVNHSKPEDRSEGAPKTLLIKRVRCGKDSLKFGTRYLLAECLTEDEKSRARHKLPRNAKNGNQNGGEPEMDFYGVVRNDIGKLYRGPNDFYEGEFHRNNPSNYDPMKDQNVTHFAALAIFIENFKVNLNCEIDSFSREVLDRQCRVPRTLWYHSYVCRLLNSEESKDVKIYTGPCTPIPAYRASKNTSGAAAEQGDAVECGICVQSGDKMMINPRCGHTCCTDCMQMVTYMQGKWYCPHCRQPIDQLAIAVAEDVDHRRGKEIARDQLESNPDLILENDGEVLQYPTEESDSEHESNSEPESDSDSEPEADTEPLENVQNLEPAELADLIPQARSANEHNNDVNEHFHAYHTVPAELLLRLPASIYVIGHSYDNVAVPHLIGGTTYFPKIMVCKVYYYRMDAPNILLEEAIPVSNYVY